MHRARLRSSMELPGRNESSLPSTLFSPTVKASTSHCLPAHRGKASKGTRPRTSRELSGSCELEYYLGVAASVPTEALSARSLSAPDSSRTSSDAGTSSQYVTIATSARTPLLPRNSQRSSCRHS
eukprot:IDg12639t1